MFILIVAMLRRGRRLARRRLENDKRERTLFEARLEALEPNSSALAAIHREIEQLRETAVTSSGDDIRRTAIVIRRWIRDLAEGEAA
jgi:hypothetical protein